MIRSGCPEVTYIVGPDAPFRRAVLDNPDDDVPRLIYADWLDEHGRHDRAEFIRLQVEAARLPTGDLSDALLVRADQLLAGKELKWCPTLSHMIGRAGWRRGFIDAMSAESRSWLRHGRSLRSEQPLRHLALWNCYGDAWRLLADDPNLDGLATLALASPTPELDEGAVRRIRQARRVNQVTLNQYIEDERCELPLHLLRLLQRGQGQEPVTFSCPA